MIEGLIGKKIGMTQFFTDDGRVLPITVIKAGPCVVIQKKVLRGKGFKKVQLGFVEEQKVKNVNKPLKGHFDKAKVPPTKILKEFLYDEDDVNLGDSVRVDIFNEKEKVRVVGITKGKGFQGVVKRWNFSLGPNTHGSMHHRRPGSTGMCAYPGEVIKGKKMPGRMGYERVTKKNLKIAKIDIENNLIAIKGAVPGRPGTLLEIASQ